MSWPISIGFILGVGRNRRIIVMAKILVIEDEPNLREEIVEWLMLEGHEVISAEDGLIGVQKAFQHLLDLILIDIKAPHLDGYAISLEIRANQTTGDIPFVFLTSSIAHQDVHRSMFAGVHDYLAKPFTRRELLQTLQTCLDKKAQIEQDHLHEVDQLRKTLQQEHEQRLLSAKMVALFSHDFRNPLASILSSSSLLHNYAERLDENHREIHFGRIEASIRQLVQMLDDLAVVSQIESGILTVKSQALNIAEFLQDIVEDFRAIHGETRQVLFESNLTDAFMADPRLLRQIATNLISNAIKYSPQTSEVRVRLDKRDGQIILEVQDKGIGIPEEDQGRLFSAFQRGSNVGKIMGTGLGLAIVKQAVDFFGGSIKITSQVNVGKTITLRLPASTPKS